VVSAFGGDFFDAIARRVSIRIAARDARDERASACRSESSDTLNPWVTS
jgi:hypothetical protein